MSRLPPVPPAGRPTHGPDAIPKTFDDVTHRVRHGAERLARSAEAAPSAEQPSLVPGFPLPLLKLLLAGFAGYVLGALTARR